MANLLAHETQFIKNIIVEALNGLDDTPYEISKARKSKALEVLTVKKPNGGRHNVSFASANKIIINLSNWQIRNIEAGKIIMGHACNDHFQKDDHVYYCEYKSFNANQKCGGTFVKIGDVDHGNLIQVLHELAHYVQFVLYNTKQSRWTYMGKPHGEGFINIYSALREKFCNDDTIRNNLLDECNSFALLSQINVA